MLLLGLPAGALADIFDRRKLLIGTQVWMMTCAGWLAALTLLDLVTPAVLLALTFAMGTGGALMGPAWQAIQPDLVPPAEFGQAVALSSMTFNTGRAIGPALGGALVAAAGPGWAFVVNGASFLGTAVVLVWWRPTQSAVRLPAETLPGALRAGWRYGANAPALRAVLDPHRRVRHPGRRHPGAAARRRAGPAADGLGRLRPAAGPLRGRRRHRRRAATADRRHPHPGRPHVRGQRHRVRRACS